MIQNIVIIPTYKEAENIERIITKVLSLDEPFDILVVDDGSPDGTAAIVKNLQRQYEQRIHLIERSGKLGLGTAYLTAFKWVLRETKYEYIYEMDADFSHNPDDLTRLYKALSKDVDLVVGSRYISGINVVNWPLGRVLMSYFASVYVRYVTGMKVRDTTAGFVGYRRTLLAHIDLERVKLVGYGFQIEMKYTAYKHGFRIKEEPIIFTDRKVGESKMHGGIFSEALWGVLKMKVISWFRRYEPATRVYTDEEKD